MLKIRIILEADAGDICVGEDFEVTHNENIINKLNGVDCQDNFVDYLDEEFKNKLNHGYMWFKNDKGKLKTITEYEANEELTEEELEKLVDYTQGQWSDGIGEGFEQEPCTTYNGEEVYVSPWYGGQKVEINQNRVNS